MECGDGESTRYGRRAWAVGVIDGGASATPPTAVAAAAANADGLDNQVMMVMQIVKS